MEKSIFLRKSFAGTGKLILMAWGEAMALKGSLCIRCFLKWALPKQPAGNILGETFTWELEFKEFLDDIKLGREPSANLADAYAALTIVEHIYRKSGYDYHT